MTGLQIKSENVQKITFLCTKFKLMQPNVSLKNTYLSPQISLLFPTQQPCCFLGLRMEI